MRFARVAAARLGAVARGGAIVLVAGGVFAVTAGATGLRRADIANLLSGPGHHRPPAATGTSAGPAR
ncbi:MAG TPA: hypothetical protein VGN59_11005 [Acidimicrobiia bacterium]